VDRLKQNYQLEYGFGSGNCYRESGYGDFLLPDVRDIVEVVLIAARIN
jgi:hypothetical protein